MRSRLGLLIAACASLALARRVEGQAERVSAVVTAAQADKTPCVKRECLAWRKDLPTPSGEFAVTRCSTSPSQQIELALAARMMARETGNPRWDDLAIIAVASAFIHDPPSYALVQGSRDAVIIDLDARLTRGELGTTLRPGGAGDYLTLADKWASQPQCTP